MAEGMDIVAVKNIIFSLLLSDSELYQHCYLNAANINNA
jgi:hypothetical protein